MQLSTGSKGGAQTTLQNPPYLAEILGQTISLRLKFLYPHESSMKQLSLGHFFSPCFLQFLTAYLGSWRRAQQSVFCNFTIATINASLPEFRIRDCYAIF